ncbi:MAG: hypothetical protein MJZ15_05770 [Bacteroidales bacterium]|nr:hypothetical protein [Bacteroidales bacterium]
MRIQRTKEEWNELRERYYDGQTTENEEQQLADYVFNADEAQTPEWDAERAVLSYLHTRKKIEAKNTGNARTRYRKIWHSIAAVAVLAFAGYGISTISTRHNDCWVSIDGNRFYSDEIASAQMEQNLELAFADFISVEDELSLIFIE